MNCKKLSIKMSESCVICLEEFGEPNIHEQPCKSCKVYFHSTCLRDYLKTKRECVFCKRRYSLDEEEGKTEEDEEVIPSVLPVRRNPTNYVGFIIATIQVLLCFGFLVVEFIQPGKKLFVDTNAFMCLLFSSVYIVISYEYFKVLFAIAAHVCGMCCVIYILMFDRTNHGILFSVLSMLNSCSSSLSNHPGRVIPV